MIGCVMMISLSKLVSHYSHIRNTLSKIGNMSLHIMALHIYFIPYFNGIINVISEKKYIYLSQPIDSYSINFIIFILIVILSYYGGWIMQKYVFSKI
jgi:fucose 4-O-acetylase-like acetyltransferase